MKKYFGLDYGTTNSLLYSFDGQNLEKETESLSAIKVLDNKEVLIGKRAWEDARSGHFEESPKRWINNLDQVFNSLSIRGMIMALLNYMLKNKGENINPERSHITLTVPYLYTASNYYDMQDILDHCLKESLGNNNNVDIHLLPEPVAAALFYVHRHFVDLPETCHLVVCDIGGGTTDMCIVECKKENRKLAFRVVSGMQPAKIGGNDFNKSLLELICGKTTFPIGFKSFHKNNVANVFKCKLSELPLWRDNVGNKLVEVTQSEFVDCIKDDLNKLRRLMRELLLKSGKVVDNSWYLLPVGGSCKIPAIRELLEEVFQGAHETYIDENTIFDSVAQGAAIYSAWCAKDLRLSNYDDISIEHCYPHEIQFKTAYGPWQTLVPQNSPQGRYPEGENKVNVETIRINISKDGKHYTLGEIVLKDGPDPLPCIHDQPFELRGREAKDIKLQLGAEIDKENRFVKCWIKDCLTQQVQEWSRDKKCVKQHPKTK